MGYWDLATAVNTFLFDILNGNTPFVGPMASVWCLDDFGLYINRKMCCMAAQREKHGKGETSSFLICFSTAY